MTKLPQTPHPSTRVHHNFFSLWTRKRQFSTSAENMRACGEPLAFPWPINEQQQQQQQIISTIGREEETRESYCAPYSIDSAQGFFIHGQKYAIWTAQQKSKPTNRFQKEPSTGAPNSTYLGSPSNAWYLSAWFKQLFPYQARTNHITVLELEGGEQGAVESIHEGKSWGRGTRNIIKFWFVNVRPAQNTYYAIRFYWGCIYISPWKGIYKRN